MGARRYLAWLVFLVVLFGAAMVGERDDVAVTQAVIWLPTGVAIAGLWLLGLRAAWVVAVVIALHRLLTIHSPGVALSAMLGSTAEAVAGVLILRRLELRADFARLRDVLALGVAAAVAPLASILCSWIGRSVPGVFHDMPFYSGWDGWWRMNALGALTVVPLALAWLGQPVRWPSVSAALEALVVAAAALVPVWCVMTLSPPGIRAIMTLYVILPVALYAALRFGPRGAISTAALGTLLVAALGSLRGGAFLTVPLEERHAAIQVFGLTLIGIPLVIGALIAEREARVRLTERQLGWQAEILELIATGRSTAGVFEALVRGLEDFQPAGVCSILLVEGRRLHVVCAPSLPQAYNASIDGVEIGPGVGSCGTAACEGRTVVVSDIATDPLWRSYHQLALPHGLKACWSVPIRAPAGAILGTFAIYHREVRAPSPAEIALVERAAALAGIAIECERRRDLLASINHNVNEGLYRSVPGLGLAYVNQACAHMFGHESPERMLELCSAGRLEDAEHAADVARLVAGLGSAAREEVRLHRRDGSVFWGLVSSTGVRAPDGSVAAYDGAISDVTVRKELEDQLRQAQRMEAVGKLAGGVAHDFNNLLTAIGGYAGTLHESLPAASALRTDADEILRATERAASLTRQLLAFSRQQVLTPRVLDPAAVVEQLGSMLRRLIGEDVRLVCRHAPEAACVRVDRGQLEQVLLNLVLNARDAMPAGGTLTITTAALEVDAALMRAHVDLQPGPYVALSVHDTGVGMSAEVRARAFEPFFTTKEPGKGTGIGLSTVYGIVRQSGGAVWIESTRGAGSTVWIYLRRVDGTPEEEPPVLVPYPSARRATVLVAEDEATVRELVRSTLARAGHTVLAAENGRAALELARAHGGPIDVLVSDVVMPLMGGPELASHLRAERPELAVLFVSGYSSEGQRLAGASSHAQAYLQKPFTSAELLERLGVLLARDAAAELV